MNILSFLYGLLQEKEIILSDNLLSLLKDMNDVIANHLIELQGKSDMAYSFIDIADDGMVSYLPSNREKGLSDDEKWSKGRQKVKIGRFVRAVLEKENIKYTDYQIDLFVNKYLAIQRKNNNQYTFKLVSGNEIPKWYLQDNYHGNFEESHTLWNSCMRYDSCQTYFKVYERTPSIKLLILLDNTTQKLVGRALVWTKCEPLDGDVTNTFIFMDRIYCYKTYMEELFKNYAKENNWWWKEQQDSGAGTGITNGRIGKVRKFKVEISDLETGEDRPFMDTLKYYVPHEGILTNDGSYDSITEIWESTDGFYTTPMDEYDSDPWDDEDDYLNENISKFKYLKTFESFHEDEEEEEEEDDIYQIFNSIGKTMYVDVPKLTEYIKKIDNRVNNIHVSFYNSTFDDSVYLKLEFFDNGKKMQGEIVNIVYYNFIKDIKHEHIVYVQRIVNNSITGNLMLKFTFNIEEVKLIN